MIGPTSFPVPFRWILQPYIHTVVSPGVLVLAKTLANAEQYRGILRDAVLRLREIRRIWASSRRHEPNRLGFEQGKRRVHASYLQRGLSSPALGPAQPPSRSTPIIVHGSPSCGFPWYILLQMRYHHGMCVLCTTAGFVP